MWGMNPLEMQMILDKKAFGFPKPLARKPKNIDLVPFAFVLCSYNFLLIIIWQGGLHKHRKRVDTYRINYEAFSYKGAVYMNCKVWGLNTSKDFYNIVVMQPLAILILHMSLHVCKRSIFMHIIRVWNFICQFCESNL